MKTILTRKQLLDISRKTGMSFHPNMSKRDMMLWVRDGLIYRYANCVDFANAVVEADKQLRREKLLQKLLS